MTAASHALIRLVLIAPERANTRLRELAAAGVVPDPPNLWQVSLGVLRMWHRVLFRSNTLGTCTAYDARPTLRARLLEVRALRMLFLMAESAVAPWDFSGLLSSPDRIRKHLLAAHHDGDQFVYDFELLRSHPEVLHDTRAQARAIADGQHPRAAWLSDLAVYERYHAELADALDAFLADPDGYVGDTEDPDISLRAYLLWCARQPKTPTETLAALRRGRYSIAHGLRPRSDARAPFRAGAPS